MKQRLLAALIALLLLCSGCQRADERLTPETAAARYTGAQLEAELTLSAFGDYPADYRVRCICAPHGTGESELLSPEDLAGLRVTVRDGGAALSYDGVILETLLPALPGYTPSDLLPALAAAIAAGAPLDWGYEPFGEEEETLTMTFQDGFTGVSGLRRIWLRQSDGALLAAECYLDDSLVLRAAVDAFSLTPAAV